MDRVLEELDETKAELEKLKVELKCKAELNENLRKAHNEQMSQIQQTNMKIKKQTEALNEKSEELSSARQMCDTLQSSLNEKESIIRQLSSANDKLRADSDKKYRELEEEKRELVLALDEANERIIDQEQKINVCMAEIEGLKGLLSASQKKLSEAEKKAKACKELRERDEVVLRLEEENRMNEDQLKWKKEQFKHLEEAHEKLRNQLRESKREWELEKSNMLDEMCRLQTSLESKTRMCESLQNQLKMCNQALAHEESRRKYLEVEICEYKARFDNVFTEFQDTKSQLEHLSTQRDKQISELRQSLGAKETFCKEAEYQARKLEQENQELLESLKELREAQIQGAGNSSSVAKMRNKLRSLEQIHRDCSANLRAKEAEWSSRVEKLIGELESCKSTVRMKEKIEEELRMELEACHSAIMQLEMQSLEASVDLLVLKSGISEVQLQLSNAEAETSCHVKERDEKVSNLMKQLEMKNTALSKALEDNREERQKVESLSERIESLELVEEQRFLLEKELERCKEVLLESSKSQLQFKEHVLQTEKELKDKIGQLCDALDTANLELATEREKVVSLSGKVSSLDVTSERLQLLQKELEKHKEMLEEKEIDFGVKLRALNDALDNANADLCVEREKAASLSRKVESFNLNQEQLHLMEKELEKYKQMLEEKETDFGVKLRAVNDALDNANADLCVEREKAASLSRKVESFNLTEEQLHLTEKELEKYKQMLDESTECQLQMQTQALQKENGFQKKLKEVSDALERVNAELAAKVCEGHAIEFELWIWESIAQRLKYDLEENQALRKELEASLLSQVEVAEIAKQEKDSLVKTLDVKDSRIDHLQQKIETLLQKLGDLQTEVSCLEQNTLARELEVAVVAQTEVESQLEAKQAELETKLRTSQALVDDLESKRTSLVEDVKKLSGLVVGVDKRISQFCNEDMQLLGTLDRMVQALDDESGSFRVKEIVNSRKVQANAEDRLPFRELN